MARKARKQGSARSRAPRAPRERVETDPYVRAFLDQGGDPEQARAIAERRDPARRLARVGSELAAVELERRRLLAERAEVVQEMRAGGWTWTALAQVAGVSHAALMTAKGK